MTMNMEMESKVTDVTNAVYTTKMSIKRIKMDAMQGGQEMSYDSNKKEEELDQMGKMLQGQHVNSYLPHGDTSGALYLLCLQYSFYLHA